MPEKKNGFGKAIGNMGLGVAEGVIGAGMGLLLGEANDKRQLEQERKMMDMQIAGQRELMQYGQELQYQMWDKTNYDAQKKQLQKAGLNPGLMYGMSGGGGVTTGSAGGSVSGGHAAGQSGEAVAMAGMGLQMGLQKAQIENIEAMTAKTKAEERNLDERTAGQGLENAFTAYMQSSDAEGKEIGNVDMYKSIRGQEKVQENERTKAETRFKLDENERQKLMNSKVMEQIGEEITLLKAKGLSEGEIYKNLQKSGKLLDAEIEWNALDIESGNVGKFISNIIKMALKPR